MSEFICLFYAKWFLRAAVTVALPRLDLEVFGEMKTYESHRPDIAKKCLRSLANRTWYMHPSLIPLSLLDENITNKEKVEIAKNIFSLKFENFMEYSYKKFDLCSLEITSVQTESG